jgi:hypothetical protein
LNQEFVVVEKTIVIAVGVSDRDGYQEQKRVKIGPITPKKREVHLRFSSV